MLLPSLPRPEPSSLWTSGSATTQVNWLISKCAFVRGEFIYPPPADAQCCREFCIWIFNKSLFPLSFSLPSLLPICLSPRAEVPVFNSTELFHTEHIWHPRIREVRRTGESQYVCRIVFNNQLVGLLKAISYISFSWSSKHMSVSARLITCILSTYSLKSLSACISPLPSASVLTWHANVH